MLDSFIPHNPPLYVCILFELQSNILREPWNIIIHIWPHYSTVDVLRASSSPSSQATFRSIICSNLGHLPVPSWQYHCQGWLGPLMGVVLWLRHNEGLVGPKCPTVTVFIAQTIITSCWIESWDPGCREDVQNATFAREMQKALHSKHVSDNLLFEIYWKFIDDRSKSLFMGQWHATFLWIYTFIKKCSTLKMQLIHY